ncbi:uncharacterized protein EI97DRAFT_381842 [Westerdykella ornata]|uniref:HOOK N-terminal domain-containing protein n=1 Tax=Westerdykella ornata TaxID=318751 RepID=A0A6A6JEV4_WESOR|nr:uncharacterized protein EI97DRAFT_381842 [Westerdykella ornata]KAF2274166.1 hypothetical protein EI97DRAFT_381842 [Westerdykella ornata]
MDDFKPELLKALLEWVNTFDLPGRITSWTQLEDGQILWQLLSDIDASYFNDSLPNSDISETHNSHLTTSHSNARRVSSSSSASATDNWIPRWQNLKHIERAVSTYIRESCGQLPVLTKRLIPDLKTGIGARDGSTMLTAKLTMAVLLASLYSPKSNERMVKVMTDLPGKHGEVIAEAIQELQALDQRMASLGVEAELTAEAGPLPTGYRTPTRVGSGRDSALEQEAQLFEANKERNALRKQVTQLQSELEVSRGRVARLEEELAEARLHLDVRGPEQGTASDEVVEKLRHDLARERQYIEGLEADLQSAREIVDSQKRRLERLTAEEAARQELRDQLQLVKAERDELKQKAKANENLKKKIQSLTLETRNLEQLREDYQHARERLQELEAVEERCLALEKVNRENGQTIVQCEQSIFEEKGKRTRVEHENLVLMKQLEQTRELQYKAEDAKRELEERIRELESSSHVNRGGSLEDELTQDESVENLDAQMSSISLMEGRVSSDTIALQQKVEILTARLKSLESETLKQMQENLGLRADMMNSKDEESQRPFLEQNERLQAAEAEIQELQRRLREKDLQTAELQNELTKKSDIDESTKNNTFEAEIQRLLSLQHKTNQKLRDLELANDEKSGLLRAALLDRDNLSPELLEIMRTELLQRVREQIERVVQATPETRAKVLEAEATEIAKTVMEAKAKLEGVKKDLQAEKATSEALRGQLEEARKESGEKGSAELQQEVENLRRENKLIMSAWYDMTTRLQSNTVILQRREAPKSWLGRQRGLVGSVGGGAGRR